MKAIFAGKETMTTKIIGRKLKTLSMMAWNMVAKKTRKYFKFCFLFIIRYCLFVIIHETACKCYMPANLTCLKVTLVLSYTLTIFDSYVKR